MSQLLLRLRTLRSHRRSFLLFSSLSAATLPTYLILNSDSLPSSATPHEQPLKALVRSYVVYSLCSIPTVVDQSPKLLDLLSRVPGLKQVTYSLVRVTFFDQVRHRPPSQVASLTGYGTVCWGRDRDRKPTTASSSACCQQRRAIFVLCRG